MRQAGALAGSRQGAADYTVNIGGAQCRLSGHTAKRIALGCFAQGDGFEIADAAVQVIELTVCAHFKLELLPVFQLAELLGLFVAGQDLVYRRSGQAHFLKQGREGIALRDNDFAVARRFFVFSFCSRSGRAVLRVYLGKRSRCRFICGLNEVCGVLILCQLFCGGFQFQV